MKGVSFFQLTLLGTAAVGGLLGGTCLAINKTLKNGEARLALFLGYTVTGATFGLAGFALGVFIPPLDVDTIRGALLTGAGFGVLGVLIMAAANIGHVVTFRYLGLRVTVEPDDPNHNRRSSDGSKASNKGE